jgi:hypothetical protein
MILFLLIFAKVVILYDLHLLKIIATFLQIYSFLYGVIIECPILIILLLKVLTWRRVALRTKLLYLELGRFRQSWDFVINSNFYLIFGAFLHVPFQIIVSFAPFVWACPRSIAFQKCTSVQSLNEVWSLKLVSWRALRSYSCQLGKDQ